MANNGRAKGQIPLKKATAADKSTTRLSSHANQTVGIKGAKVNPLTHTPRLHGRGSSVQENKLGRGSKKSLANGARLTVKPSRSISKTKTGVNTVKVKKSAPKQSLQSSGTGVKGGTNPGGRGIPFKGNRRKVVSSVPGASKIPSIVRRAASRGPAPANPGAGRSTKNPYNAKMILQNSGYKQQVKGGSKFAGV